MKSKKTTVGVAATAAIAGAIAVLIFGATFGLFSAVSAPQTDTFAAGTVVLTTDNTQSFSCAFNNMHPGEVSHQWQLGNYTVPPADTGCTLLVHYTGSLPAYIGLQLGTSGTGLYDGSANGLQLQILDNNGVYYTGGGLLNGTSAPLYVGTDSGPADHTFWVDFYLPTSAGNHYQGLNTTLTLNVTAVQSQNNGTAAGCTPGQVCATIGSWS